MRLSEIDATKIQDMYVNKVLASNYKEQFSDAQIEMIVFDGAADNYNICDIGIVFGNSSMIQERTEKAVAMYQAGRVRKLLFTGGTGGISDTKNDIAEALKMLSLAISMGVPEADILIENQAKNSFENVKYSIKLLQQKNLLKKIKSIMIITSDFHLKRCYAIFFKYLPNKHYSLVGVKNGYSDCENWFQSDMAWGTGRSIVTFEAHALIEYAKENKIFDLEILNYQKKKEL